MCARSLGEEGIARNRGEQGQWYGRGRAVSKKVQYCRWREEEGARGTVYSRRGRGFKKLWIGRGFTK